MNEIPVNHQLQCPTCGTVLDMRDLGQVLSHGNWDEDLGRHVCDPDPVAIDYTSSRQIGEPIEWLRDGTAINLS